MSIKNTMLALEKHLMEREHILARVSGLFEGELFGEKVYRKGLLIATNKRVIFFHRGLFGITQEIRTIPYDKITTYSYKSGAFFETFTIKGSGLDLQMKYIEQGTSFYLNAYINDAIVQLSNQ
jgi:hypothetical protein